MLNRRKRIVTADQFFDEVAGRQGKYELVDGEVWLMAGGSNRHGDTAVAILGALVAKLRGTGCRPANSDIGLQINTTNVRYPDVAIYCDPRDLGPEAADRFARHFPRVIFEVLSPSTTAFDRGGKIAEYKAVPSVAAIVHVDPVALVLDVHERLGATTWTQREVARGDPLVLTDPAVTLTSDEIFDAA